MSLRHCFGNPARVLAALLILWITGIAGILLPSVALAAGADISGGGKTVVCFKSVETRNRVSQRLDQRLDPFISPDDPTGEIALADIESVELLDLWNARHTRDRHFLRPLTMRFRLIETQGLSRDSIFELIRNRMTSRGFLWSHWIAETIIDPHREPQLRNTLTSQAIPLVDDEYVEGPMAPNCLLVQVAKQDMSADRRAVVSIDQRLYNRMDPLHQVALHVHEALRHLALERGHLDARYVQELTSLFFTDGFDNLTEKKIWPFIKTRAFDECKPMCAFREVYFDPWTGFSLWAEEDNPVYPFEKYHSTGTYFGFLFNDVPIQGPNGETLWLRQGSRVKTLDRRGLQIQASTGFRGEESVIRTVIDGHPAVFHGNLLHARKSHIDEDVLPIGAEYDLRRSRPKTFVMQGAILVENDTVLPNELGMPQIYPVGSYYQWDLTPSSLEEALSRKGSTKWDLPKLLGSGTYQLVTPRMFRRNSGNPVLLAQGTEVEVNERFQLQRGTLASPLTEQIMATRSVPFEIPSGSKVTFYASPEDFTSSWYSSPNDIGQLRSARFPTNQALTLQVQEGRSARIEVGPELPVEFHDHGALLSAHLELPTELYCFLNGAHLDDVARPLKLGAGYIEFNREGIVTGGVLAEPVTHPMGCGNMTVELGPGEFRYHRERTPGWGTILKTGISGKDQELVYRGSDPDLSGKKILVKKGSKMHFSLSTCNLIEVSEP